MIPFPSIPKHHGRGFPLHPQGMSQVGAVGARWLMKDRPVPSLAALGAEGGFPSGPCGNSVLFRAEIRGGNVDWLKGKNM